MSRLRVSRQTARRFILRKQHLLPPRTAPNALDVIRELGCIQIDPVNVVERNHHLVLWNRVDGYATVDLEGLAYRDRKLFEYQCNGSSLIPIEDYPYFRPWMERRGETGMVDGAPLKERLSDLIDKTYRRIETEGPLSSRDFSSSAKLWWGYSVKTKAVNLALEFLYFSGEIAVHHREGNTKVYDLAERVIPPECLSRIVSPNESMEYLAMRALKALGVASLRQWRDRLANWGNRWRGLDIPSFSPKSKAAKYLESFSEGETIEPVRVEGREPDYFVPSDDVEGLQETAEQEWESMAALLSPLDNLLWDRPRLEELFDFSYRWEIYQKAEKRRYGYYAMPVLVRDRLVGRIDPKLEREEKMLVCNLFQIEPEVDFVDVGPYITDCVYRLAEFLGAKRVVVKGVEPASLTGSIKRRFLVSGKG